MGAHVTGAISKPSPYAGRLPEQAKGNDCCLDYACLMAQVVEFYKAWDRHGALSNFSPHSVELPGSPVAACGALGGGPRRAWPSVEHFYQAQKFAGAALFVLGGLSAAAHQHRKHAVEPESLGFPVAEGRGCGSSVVLSAAP